MYKSQNNDKYFSNIARVRIVSDYYGENLNNKFKIRYIATTEPANFKGHSNDKLKTDPGGFVVRQSALSNERRVPSGPSAAPLKGDGMNQWGKPPKRETMKTGIQKNLDGRVAIRSRPGFKPKVHVKSALPVGPTAFVHTQPPSPEELARGYVYQGPSHIPDPNAPLGGSPGDMNANQIPNIHTPGSGLDPWGLMPGGTPPPDVLNNGFRPEVIVRPAGWLDINTGDDLIEDEEEVEEPPSQMELWLQEMGLDINPWLLLVGAGGVVIFIVGILIAKSVKDYRDRQELEKKQLDALARGPSGITTITGYKSKSKTPEKKSPQPSNKYSEPNRSPVANQKPVKPIDLEQPPVGYRDVSRGQSTIGTASHVYTDILDNEDDNQQGDEFTKEVTKRLKKYKYRTKDQLNYDFKSMLVTKFCL